MMKLRIEHAGALLMVGSIQYILVMIIAEAIYPGYSIADNFISDLGVGPTALIFNPSIILFGAIVIIASYLIYGNTGNIPFTAFLFLSGLGTAMVGIFPLYWGIVHDISAATAFLAGGIAAVISYRHTEPPFRWLSIVLGVFSIMALLFFVAGIYLNLGVGGMERMIAYPVILWVACYGGYLAGGSHKVNKPI